MKKIITLALAFAMVLTLIACGGEAPAGDSTTVSDGTSAGAAAYVFKTGAVEIAMNAPAADIISKLGEPVSYFEEESCAFKGLDKTYTYVNFIVYTYPKDDVDYISEIDILNDLVSTAEGVSIGDTKEMVEMAYGTPEIKGTSYSYTKGDSEIQFLFTGNGVSSIQYFAITDLK